MNAPRQEIPEVLVAHVVGTRPNFVKAASVVEALARWNDGVVARAAGGGRVRFSQLLVHTGQHYDAAMSAVFFDELSMPEPDVTLGVGSGSHAAQTAALLVALEGCFLERRPAAVLVYGDVNSTLAAALCAAKLGLPTAHVEAGLRSLDRAMPEEVNRVLTDHLSDLLFTTSEGADENLLREGIEPARIRRVGNVMIDTLERQQAAARERHTALRLGLSPCEYSVVTLHRPSNVDDAVQLGGLVDMLVRLGDEFPIVFPVHVRTRAALHAAGLNDLDLAHSGLQLVEPMGYLDFLSLAADARLIITDSGGIQAEAAALGVSCLTARTTTEWTETVTAGVNRLVDPYDHAGLDEAARAAYRAAGGPIRRPNRPPLWDGRAAGRMAEALALWLE